MRMRCANCGQELREGAKFCSYCGERAAGGTTGEEQPLYQTDVKGMRKSGRLTVYRDRTEFTTSSIQKSIYNYTALVAVRKRMSLGLGLDHIDFITEDGQTESCDVNRKSVHEAFLYIEQAVRPYLAQRKELLLSRGIQYSLLVSNTLGLVDGILNILADRVEFAAKSGRSEVICFKDVKSVYIAMGKLELLLLDGTTRAFAVDKEIRDEAASFIETALAPYIAERREALLAQGIHFSCLSSCGQEGGTLNILADRVEFAAKTGRSEAVLFKDVRAASLTADMLELALTNGTSKAFAVEKSIQEAVLSFVRNAIQPYVVQRTEGFDRSFGVDERIEVNEERGVFHILRQGGNEITEELPLAALVKCEQTVCCAPKSALGLLAGAAKAVGVQNKLGAPGADDIIRYMGVELTVRTDQGARSELVRFGDFSLGMSRTNKKYDQYLIEAARFMDYLESSCPACEQIMPAPPEEESAPAEKAAAGSDGGERAPEAGGAGGEAPASDSSAPEKDQLGIARYIEGVANFIDNCTAPMAIAIQGSGGSGRNSIMKMLSESLEGRYPDRRIWLNARLLAQSKEEDILSTVVGKELIRQLSGAEIGASKGSAVKIAKGVIELLAGAIAPDSSAGQNLVEGLFKDGAAISPEKLVDAFSRLAQERSGGPEGKVIILISDLDRLAPARAVELLEVMRNFFDCEGCVFVAAIDYSFFQAGVRENSGMDLDEEKSKALFDEIFEMSFRVPASGYDVRNYVQGKLERMGIRADGGTELNFYTELVRRSVGSEPKSMDRLFNSFLLLKNMADRELYEDKVQRLMLFALLCMQTSFYAVYDQLKRMRSQVTPELLSGLCGEDSEVTARSGLGGEEKKDFCAFARVFCDIINTDGTNGISQLECSVFAKVLEFSSITSK